MERFRPFQKFQRVSGIFRRVSEKFVNLGDFQGVSVGLK